MCESWTADDEKALLELQRRREEVMTKRRNVLCEVVKKLRPTITVDEELEITCHYATYDSLTDELIKHADAITEALKPFTRKEGNRAKHLEVPNDQN